MSSPTAIGMVSESLRNLLLGEMSLVPRVKVTLLAPYEVGGERRVNLFLYKLQENPTLRNMDWQLKAGGPDTIVPPPLSLDLFYLMTVYAQNDPDTGNASAHQVLGDAMRVFYEFPILPPGYLVAGLKDAREQIRVFPNTLDLDELSQVWTTFTQPYRLSVPYQVSVVQIDPLAEKARPMPRRVRTIGKPQLEVPFEPPQIDAMDPCRGPAGTTVTISGRSLVGWRGYVTIGNRLILDAQELVSDQFAVTLPGDLQQGFQEVCIDVSHLCRRTLFYEVTP